MSSSFVNRIHSKTSDVFYWLHCKWWLKSTPNWIKICPFQFVEHVPISHLEACRGIGHTLVLSRSQGDLESPLTIFLPFTRLSLRVCACWPCRYSACLLEYIVIFTLLDTTWPSFHRPKNFDSPPSPSLHCYIYTPIVVDSFVVHMYRRRKERTPTTPSGKMTS